ncbi:MAG: hypothetical protein WCO25_00405 [Candidatus Uhrbacteria bacterium]
MELTQILAELASAAIAQRGFDPSAMAKLSGNAFYGDTGNGAQRLAGFASALSAAGADEAKIDRISTILEAVDTAANESLDHIVGRTRRDQDDLTDGELAFLVSYLKATRNLDADPNETDTMSFEAPDVGSSSSQPIGSGDSGGGGGGGGGSGPIITAKNVAPTKVPGWRPILDDLHALLVQYESGKRRVAHLAIRALVDGLIDPQLKVIAEEYVFDRMASPRFAKDEKFIRRFGMPLEPEPETVPGPVPPNPPQLPPVKTADELAWESVRATIDAMFAELASGNTDAASKLFALRDAIPEGDPKRLVAERYIDRRFAEA